MRKILFLSFVALCFVNTQAFFGLSINVQFGNEISSSLKTLSVSISNLVPIIKNLQLNRDLLPINNLSSIKYDLITIQKYLEVYNEFILKLSSYLINTAATPGPFAIIKDINTDLKNLKAYSVDFRNSLDKLNSLTSISLTPLLREDQEDFTKALSNLLIVVKNLVLKEPLIAADVNSELTIILTYFIRNFVASSITIYEEMEEPLNILLNQFKSLVTLQTSLKSSVSSFKDDLLVWEQKNMNSINLFQQQYIKIINEDFYSIKPKIKKMQEEVLLIDDSTRTLNPPIIIDNLEQFLQNHKTKLVSANSSIMWTLNNFASFSEHISKVWHGTEQKTVISSLEKVALRILSKYPLTVNCLEIFQSDLTNMLKLASGDILGCFNDLLLALPWSFQQFTLEYNLMKAKLDEFLNYGTLSGKYIDAANSNSVKTLLIKFMESNVDYVTKNYWEVGNRVDLMAKEVNYDVALLIDNFAVCTNDALNTHNTDFIYFLNVFDLCSKYVAPSIET